MQRWARLAAASAVVLSAACTTVTTRRELPNPDSRPYPPRRRQAPARVDSTEAPAGGVAVGDSVVGIEDAGGTRMAPSTSIRVGVLVDADRVEVGGPGGLIVSGIDGREAARVPAGGTVSFASAGSGSVSVDVRGADGISIARTVVPAPAVARPANGEVLSLRGNPYRGEVVLQPSTSGALTAVNRVDMEAYLLGVVPRELGPVGSQYPEAAKAQAVAARTFAVKHLGGRSRQGFDVYASTADQVYGGMAAEVPMVSEAVRASRGEILTYGGTPIEAFYHSTCGGRTAGVDEVWNQPPVPYLISVVDVDPATGEAYDRLSGKFRWTERWTGPELVSILNRTLADSLRGRTIREVRDARVVERTASGRVRRLALETDAGSFTLGKDRVRWILLTARGAVLNSSRFDLSVSRDGSGAISAVTAEGMGWGHGIGMCQFGAIGRALAGQDYRTILRAYYPGARLVRAY